MRCEIKEIKEKIDSETGEVMDGETVWVDL